HLHWNVTHIQRTSTKQALHQSAQEFSAHVVNVGLYHRNPIRISILSCILHPLCLTEAETQTIGPGELFAPEAVTYALNSNGRSLKTGQRCQYCSSRWRDQ